MNASLPPAAALRVFLVDHANAVRQRIALLVGAIRGVVVVGEAEDGQDALTHIRGTHADVVLVDLRLADGSGLESDRRAVEGRAAHRHDCADESFGARIQKGMRDGRADYFFDKTVEFDAACHVIESLVHARAHQP